MLSEKLKNLIPLYRSLSRKSLKFTAGAIAGLIASALIALYAHPSTTSETPYRTSWIGNTFSGGSKWVQIQISTLQVAPDGTIYTNSEWDEAGREVGIYKDGDVIGKAKDLHGWGRTGGVAIAANQQYLFVAMQQEPGGNPGDDYPPKGTTWYAVRRYNLSGEPVPFSGGRGYDKSMLIVSTSSPIAGLAIAGNELYVSDRAANRIRVYNSETLRELRNWKCTRPGAIAADSQGNLWIIQAKDSSHAAKISYYSKTGTFLSKEIAGIDAPTAIALDNQNRLLVTENGPRQQVLIYNISGEPALAGTLGTEGGIYSGTPGEIGDLKFYGLSGVGTDAAGNIYVSNDGFNRSGADLRKFSPSGVLQWRLLGLQFVDTADADPISDGADVFTKDEHFVMDYRKHRGQEWTYQAYTVDKFRYPDDARLHSTPTSPFVRRLGGKRFLYLTDQYAARFLIYRFDGEIAVPSAIFAKNHSKWPANQPTAASWLWRDLNGDGAIQNNEYEKLGAADSSIWGWEVDSKGDIWQASESGYIRHYRCQGLDAYGSPIYSGAASEKIAVPAPFKTLTRIKYFPEMDVMYLGGYTVDRPNVDGDWGLVGTEIVRYDNWSQSRKARWRLVLPYNPAANPKLHVKSMDVAGDRVFAVTSKTAEVYVYDAAMADFIAKLTPGSEVAGETGWIDIPYGLRAYRRANGEYVVFVEEVWKAKAIVYRLASN